MSGRESGVAKLFVGPGPCNRVFDVRQQPPVTSLYTHLALDSVSYPPFIVPPTPPHSTPFFPSTTHHLSLYTHLSLSCASCPRFISQVPAQGTLGQGRTESCMEEHSPEEIEKPFNQEENRQRQGATTQTVFTRRERSEQEKRTSKVHPSLVLHTLLLLYCNRRNFRTRKNFVL